jgi:hypothetical protein
MTTERSSSNSSSFAFFVSIFCFLVCIYYKPGVPNISVFLSPQFQSLAAQGFESGVGPTLLDVSPSRSQTTVSRGPQT